MCLGVPGKVVEIPRASIALVDFFGVKRQVALDLLDPVEEPLHVGDYVLVHVGFAIRRIAEEDLAETLAFFASLDPEDLEGLKGPDVPS